MSAQFTIDQIFSLNNPNDLEFELRHYLGKKRREQGLPLTPCEQIFEAMVLMGGRIAGDGFVSIYHEWFTTESFAKVCAAFTEVGGVKMCALLREAWDIYTKSKNPITTEELRMISVRRFNTREKMDRFDQVGDEVVAEIQAQYSSGKVWSVEYAKLHHDEFVKKDAERE